jgi:GntR family transcriptional repressor for pyruvate dehydrogenase complex
MRKLKVGRGTVREAYRSLQQKGLIEVRHGGGAFVQEVDSSIVGDTLASLIRHRRVSTRHLQEFREAIESRCAAYAAERATPEQIDLLKLLTDQMEDVLGSSDYGNLRFYELELNLHTQLATISGNPMFEWFARTFERNAAAFSDILTNQSEKPDEALKDWRDFIQAVENREVTKAAMIIGSHILRFGKILEELDQDKDD